MSWDYVLLAGHTPVYSDLTCRAIMNTYKVMFSSKNFQDSLSHRIFGQMYGALNVDEKKLITQFSRKPRDESFKSN
jgi:hypothetical protein